MRGLRAGWWGIWGRGGWINRYERFSILGNAPGVGSWVLAYLEHMARGSLGNFVCCEIWCSYMQINIHTHTHKVMPCFCMHAKNAILCVLHACKSTQDDVVLHAGTKHNGICGYMHVKHTT